MPIKSLIATVSFTVDPQKPMGKILPDYLAVRGTSTTSKHLLHVAKNHLRPSASYGSSFPPLSSAPPTKFGKQPLPSYADTHIPETKLLHDFLTLCTDFAVISSLFCLSLLCWETEKATSMALFVCAPSGEAYRNVQYPSMY